MTAIVIVGYRRIVAGAKHPNRTTCDRLCRLGGEHIGKPTEHSIHSRRYEFVEAQAALLVLGRVLRREVPIGFDLIGQWVLLNTAGVAGGLGRPLSVLENRVVKLVGHA